MQTNVSASARELVVRHIDLVGHTVAGISSRYPRHVDREELWNAGALGLVESAVRFDPEMGIPFATYAKKRIRGAIIDSTRARDWASRSVRRRAREIEAVTEELRAGTGHTPTASQLGEAMGLRPEEVETVRARSAASMLLSLDQEPPEGEPSLRDSVSDPAIDVNPEAALDHREMIGTLREAVNRLPGIHGEVVRRYYLEGEMLQDIAADHGVTQARISQIRSEALMTLQACFGMLYDRVPTVDEDAPGRRARTAYLAQVAAQSTWRSRLDAATAVTAPVAVGASGL